MIEDKNKTELYINNRGTEITISIPDGIVTVEGMFDELLIPAMLALGYQQGSIEDYIVEEAHHIEIAEKNSQLAQECRNLQERVRELTQTDTVAIKTMDGETCTIEKIDYDNYRLSFYAAKPVHYQSFEACVLCLVKKGLLNIYSKVVTDALDMASIDE